MQDWDIWHNNKIGAMCSEMENITSTVTAEANDTTTNYHSCLSQTATTRGKVKLSKMEYTLAANNASCTINQDGAIPKSTVTQISDGGDDTSLTITSSRTQQPSTDNQPAPTIYSVKGI